MYALVTGNNTATNVLTWTPGVDGTSAIALGNASTVTEVVTKQVINATMVRLDTGASQTLTGPLVVPYSGTASTAATSWGSFPVKLDEQLLASTASSVTFVNPLPTGFRHLAIEWYARGDTGSVNTAVTLRFNNDSAANYDWQSFDQQGTSTTVPTEHLGDTGIGIGQVPAASATANYFGQGRAEIYYYQSAVGNKLAMSDGAWAESNLTGAAARLMNRCGKWRTVGTPVTRLDLLPAAGHFIIGSLFTLWGIP